MRGKAQVLAFVALGCAHYVPVRPEPGEAGGVRGEVVAINGEFLADFVVRLTPASTVPVGSFRLASSAAPPCTAGDAMKLVLAGPPEGLTLSSETVVTLEAGEAPARNRLAARDAVIDVQVGDAAASCLRIPVSGESNDSKWVSARRWGFAMNGGFAWNYAMSSDGLSLVAGLSLQRRLGAVRLGARADFGSSYGHDAGGIGPAAGARILVGERWTLAGELAYEFGGIDAVGFAHGPRASLALMPNRPRPPGFDPPPLVGAGVELVGGTWFVSERPAGAIPWYAGAGLVVVLGP
jgi:hypothetical protein